MPFSGHLSRFSKPINPDNLPNGHWNGFKADNGVFLARLVGGKKRALYSHS